MRLTFVSRVSWVLIILIMVSPVVSSCGGSGKSPSEVAQEAVEAAFEMDCVKMYNLTSENALKGSSRDEALKECEEVTAGSKELLESMKVEMVKVDTKDEKIEGEAATVTTVMTLNVMDEQVVQEQIMKLVKEGGEWKVADAPQL